MNFGADRQFLMRMKRELSEDIVIVHEVKERKTSIQAGRRQNFEKCVVFVVGRVVVTAAVEVPAAYPRFELTENWWLIARFRRQSAGLMVLGAPRSQLSDSPEQNVDLASRGFKVMDVMASECRQY